MINEYRLKIQDVDCALRYSSYCAHLKNENRNSKRKIAKSCGQQIAWIVTNIVVAVSHLKPGSL